MPIANRLELIRTYFDGLGQFADQGVLTRLARLGAVRLGATGKLPEDAILWKTAKGAPQYSSLVIDGDLI